MCPHSSRVYPPYYLSMNVYPYAVFNKVLYDTCEAIQCIMDYVSYDFETVHLYVEASSQEIQYKNSYYLVNILTPNTNLVENVD